MFKFYSFLRSSSGRNNSGSITVRHRASPYLRPKSYSYFNFKKFNFNSFRFFDSKDGASTFSVYRGQGHFSFAVSRQDSHPFPLFAFRPGSFVTNIESYPGSGSKYVRAIHSKAMLIRRLGTSSVLKLPSGEIRKFKTTCFAYSSKNDSFVKKNFFLGKAGASRARGARPHVRGCAINPVDHPHGGRSGESRPSVSPWGKLTKGFRTVSKKKRKNNHSIVLSVQAVKNRIRNPQKS
jgi:large subunit ribosomal protein L2